MRRIVLSLIVAGLLIALKSAPALAINDALVPAEECAPANAEAVGHPAATTGLAQTPQIGPPASANNPGVSTGAQGKHSRVLKVTALLHKSRCQCVQGPRLSKFGPLLCPYGR